MTTPADRELLHQINAKLDRVLALLKEHDLIAIPWDDEPTMIPQPRPIGGEQPEAVCECGHDRSLHDHRLATVSRGCCCISECPCTEFRPCAGATP